MQKKILRTSVLTLGLFASALTTLTDVQAQRCACTCYNSSIANFRVPNVDSCQAWCKEAGLEMAQCLRVNDKNEIIERGLDD